jgi:septal ring factor EnvC (AmiA/AmiB activator)
VTSSNTPGAFWRRSEHGPLAERRELAAAQHEHVEAPVVVDVALHEVRSAELAREAGALADLLESAALEARVQRQRRARVERARHRDRAGRRR